MYITTACILIPPTTPNRSKHRAPPSSMITLLISWCFTVDEGGGSCGIHSSWSDCRVGQKALKVRAQSLSTSFNSELSHHLALQNWTEHNIKSKYRYRNVYYIILWREPHLMSINCRDIRLRNLPACRCFAAAAVLFCTQTNIWLFERRLLLASTLLNRWFLPL